MKKRRIYILLCLLLIVLVFLFVCLKNSKNIITYNNSFKYSCYLDDGNYYYLENESIYSIDENSYESKICENCLMIKENNLVYAIDLSTKDKRLIGSLNINEIINNNYKVKYTNTDSLNDHYYEICFNDIPVLEIHSNSNFNNSIIYQKYVKDNKLYFVTINNYKNTTSGQGINRWNSNYVNSDLYCIDLSDYSYKKVYSSDSNHSIVCGDEKYIYLVDKNSDIYCNEIELSDLKLIHSTNYKGEILIEYTNNMIFMFTDKVEFLNTNN